jgi:uncharacterized protein (TIGR02246 family)
MDEAVQELIEARAIEQLMIHYIDRIDANDPVGAAACFTEDGLGVYWGDYHGREAIAERLAGILDAFTATSHHLTNVAPVITGDTATSQAYVYAFHRRVETNAYLHIWGRWVDELRKVDGRWLFARREVLRVGAFEPSDVNADREHPGHPGRLAR